MSDELNMWKENLFITCLPLRVAPIGPNVSVFTAHTGEGQVLNAITCLQLKEALTKTSSRLLSEMDTKENSHILFKNLLI